MSRLRQLYEKLISDCISFNLKPEEAREYIRIESGHKISRTHYYRIREKQLSEESSQTWLNQFTRIGFVQNHRKLLDDATKVYEGSLNRYFIESIRNPPDKELIIKLESSYRENAKLVSDLSAGTPIIAALKAKLQESNNNKGLENKENATRNTEISEGVITQPIQPTTTTDQRWV